MSICICIFASLTKFPYNLYISLFCFTAVIASMYLRFSTAHGPIKNDVRKCSALTLYLFVYEVERNAVISIVKSLLESTIYISVRKHHLY